MAIKIKKQSKPLNKVVQGDKIKVDKKEYTVDDHHMIQDHGHTKEMVIECFDEKLDKDYELRYFEGQLETSIEFFELKEIIYDRVEISEVEW